MTNSTTRQTVILPDLLKMCNVFPFGVNPLAHIIGPATDRWLEAPGSLTNAKARVAQAGLKAGLRMAMCLPWCNDVEKLQVAADFDNYLFHLDDLTDEMDLKDVGAVVEAVMGVIREPELWTRKIERGEAHAISVLMHEIWQRFIRGCGPGVRKRFERTFYNTALAAVEEARMRKKRTVPSFGEFVVRRRDNSAVRPSFALIEYGRGIELPQNVLNHPVIRDLEDAAVDLVSWANDVYSFPKEYACSDTHNLVIVLLYQKSLSVQGAMDYSGELFQQRIDEYLALKAKLPSWGPEIDKAVELYVEGMEYWISGSAEWHFWSKRYFGDEAMLVKATRVTSFEHPKLRARLA
ncbi:terpenoid synthase [Calocera viscosa TUFC12733]|uniref:Terpene synthase n=1 Tax=Calocera viscosa (strain TUFC12733) TaxID=1330018 RepID=A0A167KCC8_CALVF|nr:terpenoid synthase [Calocera viscosa TUFC12733]